MAFRINRPYALRAQSVKGVKRKFCNQFYVYIAIQKRRYIYKKWFTFYTIYLNYTIYTSCMNFVGGN